MSRSSKTLLFGLLIALIGVAASFVDVVHELEEDSGLGLLFKLRGVRPAPSEVVIVSIDRESSERLSLPENPDRWPRSLHARLIERLAREGASVIVFDLYFVEPRSALEDDSLAEAIRLARNVVLVEPLKAKDIPASKVAGFLTAEHRVVETIKPIGSVSRAAFASAPFVLPKLPVKVNQYWAFQTAAGDMPTFPVVAFQLYALPAYQEFFDHLKKVNPIAAPRLSQTSEAFQPGGAIRLIRELRAIFESDPSLAGRMHAELKRSGLAERDPSKFMAVESLIGMYKDADHRYLNYYGPPRSLRTLPFHQIVLDGDSSSGGMPIDFEARRFSWDFRRLLSRKEKTVSIRLFRGPTGFFSAVWKLRLQHSPICCRILP